MELSSSGNLLTWKTGIIKALKELERRPSTLWLFSPDEQDLPTSSLFGVFLRCMDLEVGNEAGWATALMGVAVVTDGAQTGLDVEGDSLAHMLYRLAGLAITVSRVWRREGIPTQASCSSDTSVEIGARRERPEGMLRW